MTMTEVERLVAVETKLTSVEKTVNKIDQKLDILIPTFATTAQLAEHKAGFDKQITELEAEFDKQILALENDLMKSKTRSTFLTWITGTLSAIFGAVMMFLIQSYLSK